MTEEDDAKTSQTEDERRKSSSMSFLSEIRKRRKHGNVSLAPANVRTPFAAIPTIANIVGRHLKRRKDSILVEIGYGDGRILIGCCEILGCRGVGFEILSEERQRALKHLEIAQRERKESALPPLRCAFHLKSFYVEDGDDAAEKELATFLDWESVGCVVTYMTKRGLRKALNQLKRRLPSGTTIVSSQYPESTDTWMPGAVKTHDVEVETDKRDDGARVKWRIVEYTLP